VAHRKVVASAPIPSINVEGMAIDTAKGRLFLNMRVTHAIGMFDTKAHRLLAHWVIPGMTKNTPLAYDPATSRLFAIGRDPGKLYVIDSHDGRLVSTVDCPNGGDDITYDPVGRRLFVSTDDGFAVLARRDDDHFEIVQQGDSRGGKTSIYVPSLARFYVGRAPIDQQPATLDVYAVSPAK
jgi:DNA-binding beta-propeller fold protein YncE